MRYVFLVTGPARKEFARAARLTRNERERALLLARAEGLGGHSAARPAS